MYNRAFHELKKFPKVETMEDNERLTSMLKDLVGKATPVVELLAQGTNEALSECGPTVVKTSHTDGCDAASMTGQWCDAVCVICHLAWCR